MLKQMGWMGLIVLSGFLLPHLALATPITEEASPVPLVAQASSPNPRPVPETKRVLIRQLLDKTGGRKMYEQMQQLMISQIQQQVQPMMKQMLSSNTRLSASEERALMAKLNSNVNSIIGQFKEVLRTEMTYDEMLEKVYYPLYDQYFTDEDLKSLLAFYDTPIGKKLIAVSPQMMQSSMQLTNQVFMPKMMKIFGRLMQDQFKQMGQ